MGINNLLASAGDSKNDGPVAVKVLQIFFTAVALFLIVDVIAGIISFMQEARPSRAISIAEHRHIEYDKDLGWINIPNVFVKDMYGPGKYLRINSQRFRNNSDCTLHVPAGKIRVIAAGDSFTFGYGVDNDHTWLQQLVRLDKRLEVVNMGQGGYGMDQAYLCYKRDGAKFDHDIFIFSFITEDFKRMNSDSFLGYGKPILAIENKALVTKNQPVPKYQKSSPRITSIRRFIGGLWSVRLLQKSLYHSRKLFGKDETHLVVAKVMDDIKAITRTKNAIPVLVFLASYEDYAGNSAEIWRRYMAQVASAKGVILFDLIEDFRNLPAEDFESLFIGEGVIGYDYSAYHYNEKGNAVIAGLIYERFMANPSIASKIASAAM